MAITLSNPLRALWGYLRGDDLKAADARALAARTPPRPDDAVEDRTRQEREFDRRAEARAADEGMTG